MGLWADYTLPHDQLTGKAGTDKITLQVNTQIAYADPIPITAPLLIEAKNMVETYLLRKAAEWVLKQGTPEAFLDAALADPVLSLFLPDPVAWGYTHQWCRLKFGEEGDRLWELMMLASKDDPKPELRGNFEKAMDAFIALFPQYLGDTDRDPDAPIMRGTTSEVDLYDLDW